MKTGAPKIWIGYPAVFLLLGLRAAWAAVSQDVNGWTVVTPSADSRIVYVSASGGSDSNNGLSSSTPVKTLDKGRSLLRPGFPDEMLLKAGDVWRETLNLRSNGGTALSGRSTQEPMLLGAYGSGARPRMNILGGIGLYVDSNAGPLSHFFAIGMDIYDGIGDPASPDFNASANPGQGVGFLDSGSDILVEDCSFRFLYNGVNLQTFPDTTTPVFTDVRFRRNLFLDGHVQNGGQAQGMFINLVDSFLAEENVFDHNGWLPAAGAGAGATVFHHSIYFNNANHNGLIKGNVFMRQSSISVKLRVANGTQVGTTIQDNLFVEGEIGVSFDDEDAGCLYQDALLKDNVFMHIDRNNPTGRGLGWTVDMRDADGATVTGNLFMPMTLGNTFGLYVNVNDANVTVANNTMYGIPGDIGGLNVGTNNGVTNVVVSSNTFQNPSVVSSQFLTPSRANLVTVGGTVSSISFSSNTYFTSGAAAAVVGGANKTYAQWTALTGEPGARNLAVSFPDPTRTVETYDQALGGSGTESQLFDDFIQRVRQQSNANWHPELRAAAVNDYVRAGFGMAVAPPPPPTPPTTPGTPVLTVLSSSQIKLDWTDAAGETSYRIERSLNNVIFSTVTSAPTANTITYTDPGLSASTTYYYRVAAKNAVGETLSGISSARTLGTGVVGPAGLTPPPGLKEACAYPNPAKGVDPVIRAMMGGVDSVEITIFDQAGQAVKSDRVTTSVSVNGETAYEYKWTGEKASGIYYAVIHGKKGNEMIRARASFAVVK